MQRVSERDLWYDGIFKKLQFQLGTWSPMSTNFDRKYSARLFITCQTEIEVHFEWIGNALKFQYLEFAITWLFFEFLALKFRTSIRNVCSTWPWLRIVSITWLGNELLKRFALQLLVVGSQFFYLTFDDLPVKVNFKSFRFQNSWDIHFPSISIWNFPFFVEKLNWQLLIGSQNRWLDPINLTMIRLN